MAPEFQHAGVSWKDYVDTRLESLARATSDARQTMEKRLEGMNEFRDALKDQSAGMTTRAEFRVFVERVNAEIATLRETGAELRGKASQNSVLGAAALAVLSLLLAMAALFWK